MNLLAKSLLEITAQCISIRLGLVLRLGFGYSGLQSSLPEPAQNLRIARQNVSYTAISLYLLDSTPAGCRRRRPALPSSESA